MISEKAEELANALEITLEEKELLHKESRNLIEDIQNSKKAEKESLDKLQILKQELQEMRVLAFSTQAIAKTYINKFYSSSKGPNNSLISKQFTENIREYFDYINNNNNNYNSSYNKNFGNNKEKNMIQTLKFLEDYTRTVGSEMEMWFDKLKNYSEENKEFLNKIKSLEQTIHNTSLINEEKIILERKLNQNVFELKEENKSLNEDIQSLEQQCEKLVSDYKQVRNELKKKLEEIGDLKHEIRESNNSNLKLNGILKDKENNVSFLNFQIMALEDRIVIISKEKKNLENLIERVCKSHPAKEIQKLTNELLTIYDCISQLERDKSKIEQSLKNLESQNLNNNNNANNYNTENTLNKNMNLKDNNGEVFSLQMKIEKDSLRKTIEDLEKKISNSFDIKNYLLFL